MPRAKTYSDSEIVQAAQEVFWESGFTNTAISDLERGTGLNRSSLYHAFGPKRALFELVLKSYVTDFIDPLLEAMERQTPRVSDIASFFLTLSALFASDDKTAKRGCLLVNAIGDPTPGDDEVAQIVAGFPERLRNAFARSLGSSTDMTRTQIDRKAAFLSAATLGIWLTTRVDPRMAVRRCEDIAREVASWSRRPRATRSA